MADPCLLPRTRLPHGGVSAQTKVSRMPRRPVLGALLAASFVGGAFHCTWRCSTMFLYFSARPLRRGIGLARHVAKEDTALAPEDMWQRGLDIAFLEVDASLEERLAGLRELLSRPGAVLETLREALLAVADEGREQGGHARALDALFPRGTLARADLEGLIAVARQVPEVLGDFFVTGTVIVSEAHTGDIAPSLDQVRRTLQDLLSPVGLSGVADAAIDGLRSTPKALQAPTYDLFDDSGAFEVRRYRDFTLATPRQALPPVSHGLSAVDPFSALAMNLLSGRSRGDGPGIDMTLPMYILYNLSSTAPMSVSFLLPPGTIAATDAAQSEVDVMQVPERLLAVRRFRGIASAAEVHRQYERLLTHLARDDIFVPVRPREFSVLQYNPLHTVPWRRRNEVAVEVACDAVHAERVANEIAATRAAATAAAEARAEAEASVASLVSAKAADAP